jgi:hypothetical protein
VSKDETSGVSKDETSGHFAQIDEKDVHARLITRHHA